MYVAIDKRGELKNALDGEITKTVDYFCPHCHEKLIFKQGRKIQSHFAHQKNSSCSYNDYKKESAEHLTAKKSLYEYFKNKYSDVRLEYIFKTGDSLQIADVYLAEKNVAFEYQRSVIPFTELLKRTHGYEKANINLIWLIDINKFVKELKRHNNIFYIRYAPFVDNFLNYHKGCIFFYGYDRENESIVFYQLWSLNLKKRNAICKKKIIKLTDISLPLNVSLLKENNMQLLFKNDIENYIKIQLRYDKTVKNQLLSLLYNARIALDNIPKEIGINYNEQLLFRTPLLLWQVEFYRLVKLDFSFRVLVEKMSRFIKFKESIYISKKKQEEILLKLIKKHYGLL